MLGVVLWSSAIRERAVIWCEDQQALAYLRDAAAITSDGNWPEAGDIVEIEVATEAVDLGDLRIVTRLDHQPGRMPVVEHLPSSPPPPLWMAANDGDLNDGDSHNNASGTGGERRGPKPTRNPADDPGGYR